MEHLFFKKKFLEVNILQTMTLFTQLDCHLIGLVKEYIGNGPGFSDQLNLLASLDHIQSKAHLPGNGSFPQWAWPVSVNAQQA